MDTSHSMSAIAADTSTETKSISSRSTRGSAVLARAREYNRIIDENRSASRSKSRDRNSHNHNPSPPRGGGNGRSNSAPRTSNSKHVSQMSQRERAMASVQAERTHSDANARRREVDGTRTKRSSSSGGHYNPNNSYEEKNTSPSNYQQQHQHQHHQQQQQHQQNTQNQHNMQQQKYKQRYRTSPTPSQKSAARSSTRDHREQSRNKSRTRSTVHSQSHSNQISPTNPVTNKENNYRDRDTHGHGHAQQPSNSSRKESRNHNKSNNNNNNEQNNAIVTPELLVDALSGHEDGLLAIAERLMEHYDAGYDVMGEAIIDAFADVQKLFQHVVEAAHMEGAAYEAGRKEEEIERLKRALGGEGGGGHGNGQGGGEYLTESQKNNDANQSNNNGNSPLRHEEFVDQDVRDVLVEAIRKGQVLKDSQKFNECYQLYEQCCNSASALLPVDSDHRGRLQLSIARAESMNAERACAILKYVMDDVLRSGLTSTSKVVMMDPSQRGDCVLSRPPQKTKIMNDSSLNSKYNGTAVAGGDGVVLQSSEEALASMVEEMKEILGAPVYDNSPLQSVAERFWGSLSEAQRNNMKTEERLEQKLGELKGDFLLARMVCQIDLSYQLSGRVLSPANTVSKLFHLTKICYLRLAIIKSILCSGMGGKI
jgi:hypothetical protein